MKIKIPKIIKNLLIFVIVVLISIILYKGYVLLCKGALFNKDDETYDSFEIGDTFYHNRDGYFMKLPHRYCLDVLCGETTSLFRVSTFQTNISFDDVYNNPSILCAHYIKGYYNDEYLVLCEQKEDKSLTYWSFCFEDETVTQFDTEEEVFESYNFGSKDWFSLCNKYFRLRITKNLNIHQFGKSSL